MTSRDWLSEGAARAKARLEALPYESLGSAARILLGYKDVPCPNCKGRGTVTIRADSGQTTTAVNAVAPQPEVETIGPDRGDASA